ncbi:hypothetical protein [uncultured Nitrosomonas sp.]|uniref:hypothetical protein n=2 Tax=Nitrosomonas TaxID=914 RepID=UPI00260B8F59|nr:hypothetical protein [uncultured Nitrosomonas sp.]
MVPVSFVMGRVGGFGGSPGELDTANLESIEALRGPAAVLFDRIEPGGLDQYYHQGALEIPCYSVARIVLPCKTGSILMGGGRYDRDIEAAGNRDRPMSRWKIQG